jgi:hypothetical protein
MTILTTVLVAVHIVSSAMWVGAVFMGSIIDPPALRNSAKHPPVLMDFIIEQGIHVFPWVYTAMAAILLTGLILTWLHPPQTALSVALISLKFIALGIMAGNTFYGTRVTWPKILFADPDEVLELWRPYLIRAYVTLGCGIFALILGVINR